MKRLFCVTSSKGTVMPLGTFGHVDEPTYTDDKQHAKHVRDELGGTKAGYHISRGPDNVKPSRRHQRTHSHSNGQSTGDGFKRRK